MSVSLRNVAKVASNTFLSRLLGFARDVILAHLFGAGMAADAFFVAQRLPNLFRRLFGEGAFSQAFVPVLGEYVQQRSPQETREFVADISGWLLLTLLIVTAAGVLGAGLLVYLLAPGFAADPAKYQLTVLLTRIVFPYLLLVSLVALSGGILNTYGHFQVPAFTPVFLNLGIIAAALFWAPHLAQPVIAVAWGMIFGGIAQLLFQIPALYRIGHLHWPRLRRGDPGVGRTLRLLGPAALGASAAQINLFINTVLASLVGANVVSYLYYSDRLVEFPLGVFGVALGTVVLPTLSRQSKTAEFPRTLDWALRWTWLIALPATIGLLVLGKPLLITLFRYGAYSAQDMEQSYLSLFGYGLGILPIIAARVLAPAFYARQNTQTPMRFGIISVAVNILISLLLAWPLHQLGLSLATSIAALANALLLARRLWREEIYRPAPGWRIFLVKTTCSAMALAIGLVLLRGATSDWLHWSAGARVAHLLLLIGGSVGFYLFLLWALRLPELRQLRRR
ncbi:murein biosynthesis integral membrane protein MurJ [Acidithiobacillus sp. AMEEHan]|uniref:murein biosynthesis integral membrane protein MurJ n=1 Tax=Acidithiobacillus sp. AMEEHan TaxID=2994951 RepID=UPI0027E4FE82|nr:murein biosynthesis integral membrane protein MurJ [Acidithiobacillus sp. AMEEHan]